jgi:hypothetical protein
MAKPDPQLFAATPELVDSRLPRQIGTKNLRTFFDATLGIGTP